LCNKKIRKKGKNRIHSATTLCKLKPDEVRDIKSGMRKTTSQITM